MPRGVLAFLSFALVALALGALELGVRGAASAGWISLPPKPPTLAQVLEEQGYLLDRELLFRRPPGYQGTTPPGVPFSINALGLRGPELELAKPPDTWRVLALGDSTVFGFGVPFAATFSRALERRLGEAWPGVRVEVINAGMLGYSIYNTLVYLKKDGLRFEPDLIVLQTNANDRRYVDSASRRDGRMEFTWLYYRERLRSGLLRSVLYRNLDRMRSGGAFAGVDGEGLFTVPLDELNSRVSPERFGGFLDELIDLARERDIGVVLLGLREAPDVVRDYDRALELAGRGSTMRAIGLLNRSHPFLRIAAAARANELLDEIGSPEPRIPSIRLDATLMNFDGSIPVQTSDDYLEILAAAGGRDGVVSLRIPHAAADGSGIYHDFVHLNEEGHSLAGALLFEAVSGSAELGLPSGASRVSRSR